MVDEVTHTNADFTPKLRRPWAVATLVVLTLGIYWIWWYYVVNREMRDFGASQRDSELSGSKPWKSVLAVTIGGLVVVPALVSMLGAVGRVESVERIATGRPQPVFGLKVATVAAVLLPLGGWVHGAGIAFSLIGFVAGVAVPALVQARLNAAWRASHAIGEPHAPVTDVSLA